MSAFEQLHPALQYHVVNSLGWHTLRPTQLAAIAPIHAGAHCLLLAPTAGGKTEAAILPVLSRMLLASWPGTSVLYVCPIKALLNNLEPRLRHYAGLVGRTVAVWHGDVSPSRKQHALQDPPDILLTTPESIEAMLISVRVDRPAWFGHLRAVVVDELHAFAADDRGWHLRALLQRLERYAPQPLQRIGLSATVRNPEELLAWLAPQGPRQVVGQATVSTEADVTVDHVGNLENAATVIARLHRGEKRLVFCDSRSSAEQLSSLLRAQEVRTFVSHASLSLAQRRQAEAAFGEEKDCVIVATSTLELGIDVGDLDRVIQIDAPASVSSFLQRMGRTGRRAGSLRNCLFLTTHPEAFMLALGITRLWSQAWVEAAEPPPEPWPIVAQQALAATLERGEWPLADLLELLGACFPELPRAGLRAVVEHLLAHAYLDASEGLVRIGPTTEHELGRSHYRELLASFSGAQLLSGRCGSAEVGYIDPTVVSGETPQRLLLLAGRSWWVKDVEWPKRIVWLEPAKEGGTARWMGSARSLSWEVCQAIRGALVEGCTPTVQLSRRGKMALADLQDTLAPSLTADFSHSAEASEPRTWTFAGTRQNRTYARVAAQKGVRIKFDALSVQAPASALLGQNSAAPLALSDEELANLAQGFKFTACVPAVWLQRMVVVRLFVATPQGDTQ